MDAPAARHPALELGFELEAILERLRGWVEAESPTFEPAAVNTLLDRVAGEMALLGAQAERLPGTGGFGDALRARLPHPAGPAAPGILVPIHLDTVHPLGSLRRMPFRREGPVLRGPGVLDMKGGGALAVEAAARLAAAGIATRLPVTFLFTSDEEAGSPAWRPLIEAEARRARCVLVPEPAHPDGGLVTGRHGIARYRLRTTGQPAGGWPPTAGRGAIREMCRLVPLVEALGTEACSFSVGVIRGGRWAGPPGAGGAWSNCIPAECEAEVLSMAASPAALEAGAARLLALRAGTTPGEPGPEIRRGPVRPAWQPGPGTLALGARARALGGALGMELTLQAAPGGSDGNFSGALGVPTLDGLGPVGAGAHTPGEHLQVASLVPRARLLAALLAMLG